MDRLVFIMAHCCVINVSEFVESELAVETQIVVALLELVAAITVRRKLLHLFMTRDGVVPIKNAPGASAGKELQSSIDQGQPATMFEARVKVSHLAQLRNDPAFLHDFFVTLQLFRGIILRN